MSHERLNCEECGQPIRPGDLPLVVEWGHKSAANMACPHIGRPIKRAVHLQPCGPTYFAKHPIKKKSKGE